MPATGGGVRGVENWQGDTNTVTVVVGIAQSRLANTILSLWEGNETTKGERGDESSAHAPAHAADVYPFLEIPSI